MRIAAVQSLSVADNLLSYGCTLIVRPDGEIVGRVFEGLEGATVFDVPVASVTASGGRAKG